MRLKIYLQGMVCILLVACGSNESSSQAGANGALSPVETKKANADYKPAFTGQTRIAGVKTSTPYKVDQLAENIGRPWAVIPMPGNKLLITDKMGSMQIRDANGKLIKEITGFPEVDSRGQGGLLDVALDPAFSSNNMIYWSFSEKQDKGNLMAVAKGKLNEATGKIENPTVIFRANPPLESNLHFGSRLVFDKSGNLFVSTGERSILQGRAQAQLLSSGLGKIFKITKDGKPAPGNPFTNKQGVMPEIFAYGVRNAQGLDIHPVTGELWEAEFGPRGGDEVNIIRAGKNYGWPVITYGLEYSGQKIGDAIQQKSGMEQPVYYWDPVLSPSGIAFYKGNTIPEWKNNLFIGGLSSQHIARLVIKNNKVVGEERLLEDKKERFRDVAYYNGMLYAITDSGKLFRISKK
ncbi:MAG TPA: PQQ-dependent sugar dehydrogenase [Chitinophagaceae bacterium]|nr:PQQ-dependent sugar dehydrogenase [Chitinophagaceae bacterium]HPG12935.1 PQQ-dependent sugar dehydrogenase [Chitinophagaceae bacterium]